MPTPNSQFTPASLPSPFGVHTVVLYICVSISTSKVRSSIPFS